MYTTSLFFFSGSARVSPRRCHLGRSVQPATPLHALAPDELLGELRGGLVLGRAERPDDHGRGSETALHEHTGVLEARRPPRLARRLLSAALQGALEGLPRLLRDRVEVPGAPAALLARRASGLDELAARGLEEELRICGGLVLRRAGPPVVPAASARRRLLVGAPPLLAAKAADVVGLEPLLGGLRAVARRIVVAREPRPASTKRPLPLRKLVASRAVVRLARGGRGERGLRQPCPRAPGGAPRGQGKRGGAPFARTQSIPWSRAAARASASRGRATWRACGCARGLRSPPNAALRRSSAEPPRGRRRGAEDVGTVGIRGEAAAGRKKRKEKREERKEKKRECQQCNSK